jgi:hypothetical protein
LPLECALESPLEERPDLGVSHVLVSRLVVEDLHDQPRLGSRP